MTVVILIFVDGLLKPHFPGSLRDPAPMAGLFPQRWSTVPLSLGLLMCMFLCTCSSSSVADDNQLLGAATAYFLIFIVICAIRKSTLELSTTLTSLP